MSVVHTDMNIPTIPGLEPHPVQAAEQARLAALKAESGTAATGPQSSDAPKASSSLMSDQTREALKRVAQALRKAGGLSEPAPAPAAPATPGAPPGQAPPEKRAQGATPRIALPPGTVGAVQPPLDETSRRAVP
jgi:penicillin-binding protein 1A